MGIDSRYFGPSAWQLFHLIAFRSDHPEKMMTMIQNILPCKFCRESMTEFAKESPPKGDIGRWLFDIHNKVNNKLRLQSQEDPAVTNPGPDPTFEEIKERYMRMKPTQIVGRDFLFSLAINYPDNPAPEEEKVQLDFLEELAKVYPFKAYRFSLFLKRNPPALKNAKTYRHWMYALLSALANSFKVDIPSYKGFAQHAMYYKSGCSKKTYRGKTCRKTSGGFLTKNRDTRRTFRVAHKNLIQF
jgi:hypothetical protein